MQLYEISKRVKKGTHDADVINFIMDNQTTSTALAPLSEGEKNRIQELYRMIENKPGNIKFDLFWRRLRNCFDDEDSSAQDKVTHHVAFDKPLEKYSPTIDKRTQLPGKAGPEKSKREEDNPKSAADDNQYVTNKRFNDLFSLMGQLVKNSNLHKENQGQGRRGDRDRGDYKERHPDQRQGGGDRKQQCRDYDESRQYANTATGSGWRSGKGFDKHGTKAVEKILIISNDTSHTLHSKMMCFWISTGSARRTSNMMVARCLITSILDQSPVNTISLSTKPKTTRLLKNLFNKDRSFNGTCSSR